MYRCITKCPELGYSNEKHCIFTKGYLDNKREYDKEICPCGNIIELEEIKDNIIKEKEGKEAMTNKYKCESCCKESVCKIIEEYKQGCEEIESVIRGRTAMDVTINCKEYLENRPLIRDGIHSAGTLLN